MFYNDTHQTKEFIEDPQAGSRPYPHEAPGRADRAIIMRTGCLPSFRKRKKRNVKERTSVHSIAVRPEGQYRLCLRASLTPADWSCARFIFWKNRSVSPEHNSWVSRVAFLLLTAEPSASSLDSPSVQQMTRFLSRLQYPSAEAEHSASFQHRNCQKKNGAVLLCTACEACEGPTWN